MAEERVDFQADRWKRYGKDRLYITDREGSKLGWWDFQTGEGHPLAKDQLVALTAMTIIWLRDHPEVQAEIMPQQFSVVQTAPLEQTQTQASMVTDTPVVEQQKPWHDLAENKPGEAVRLQAKMARDAAPLRTAVARLFDAKTQERAWRLGAVGEEQVGEQLRRVQQKDARWHFLHSVPVGKADSDIDHVLIGPGGVFTANTKHHPGGDLWVGERTFMVNGQRVPYIRNSLYEADRARKLLLSAGATPGKIIALLIPVNEKTLTVKRVPEGFMVVERTNIARWLLSLPQVLTEEQIEDIYRVARRSTTWHA